MVQENRLKKVIIICGATATGKTALSVEIAKRLNSEVISADSMNIYKGLDIGTAKPEEKEKRDVVHHLIDVVSPFDEFTVGDYKSLAKPVVDRLISEGKIPVICGGTGFYINSLLYNLSYGNGSANMEVREHYKNLAAEKGNLYVYDILKEKDPESAEKLHFNDLKRVIRALEIYENGTKKSDIKDDMAPNYDYRAYAIIYPREELHKRINDRVDLMIKNGLVSEVKNLMDSGVTINNQCMQGIGYKEIYAYLKGETTLDQAVELIKLNTRHYAKRQETFFKRYDNITYLSPDKVENLASRILENL